MNHEVVSGIINSLPIEKMVAAPVMAAVKAQSQISAELAKFINQVGLDKDGNVRMVTFKYGDKIEDGAGGFKSEDRYIQAPFLALTGVPNFAMESVNITFDLEVKTAEEEKSSTTAKAETEAGYKSVFSPFTAKFTGSVTHSSEQTRRTDTSAKYHFEVNASRQAPPEGLMRILDTITNAATNPTANKPAVDNLLDTDEKKPASGE